MKRLVLALGLAAALLGASACRKQASDSAAIRSGILQHLNAIGNLNMSAMDMDVRSVSINGNQAHAEVEFRPKASNPSAFRSGSECPRCLPRPTWPATLLRVAPPSARVCRVGDEDASCPASSVHWLCRRWRPGYPRISHAFRVAGLCDSSGCPASSLLFATLLDTGLGLPRVQYRPAWPAMEIQVASTLASFGGADWRVSELPRLSVLRYRRRLAVRVTPSHESSGSGWWSLPDRSGTGSLRFHRWSERRVASLLTPLMVSAACSANLSANPAADHASSANFQVSPALRFACGTDGLISKSP